MVRPRLFTLLVALSAALANPLHAVQPSEPIHNFQDMPVHTRGATPSPSQVREAIITAGRQVATVGGSSWQIEEIEPGQLVGKLRWGRHAAEITIPYTSERYSVVYRGSTNLDYAPDGPSIHPTYNKLVRTLVFKIQSGLNAVHGDPTRVTVAPAPAPEHATGRLEPAGTVAVSIFASPGTRRSRAWPTLVAEWQNHMPSAVNSVGADLLTVRESEPAAMRKPGTLVAVQVNSFRYVSPARPYTRPPAFQGTPTNASLDVTVQFFDLMTGDPVGSERAYRASALEADYAQSTNLQVRNMAQRIMADWRTSLGGAPAAAAAPEDAARGEVSFWESVRDSRNPAELQSYLDQYPNGVFAPLAKARLAALAR